MTCDNSLHGIEKILKDRGQRFTKSRLMVLNYMCKKSKHVSVKQLQTALPDINIVTLYRILDFFIKQGIVRELNHDPKEKLYELDDPYHKHHHHAICKKCNKSNPIDCEFTLPLIKDFKTTSHEIIIYGYCNNCK